ncbi:hypothetical protein [Parvularcula sp. LCG005]|uniref:hypothetical protein n=1 Tax=Parvularcula sp. LCG005 TaxID=3078805 RepID=UPI002942E920|nr:hypothetical protein [Parvularcula sp. LCG005]WOI54428.1 hypothetical protein RUI03_05350 [Parvularcula sp. LCG005]
MVTVTGRLNGADAVVKMDRTLSDLREQMRGAVQAADAADARLAHIRETQLNVYRDLATIRMDLIQTGGSQTELDQAHARARDLLAEHDRFIAREARKLETAAATIGALEEQRESLNSAHYTALTRYEKKVAEVEASLQTDATYRDLSEAFDKADAVAERARQKLLIAQTDREEKGKPYDEDPLFSYLWKRRFRTADYKASPITRMLDNWVARICQYDKAYLNYNRLVELPLRLAEHVEMVEAAADAAQDRLEDAEQAALEKAGAERLRQGADSIAKDIVALDQKIESAEEEHRALTTQHDRAVRAEAGPAVEAKSLLTESLRLASVRDLRSLAAETVSLADDRMVDELIRLRSEYDRSAAMAEDATALPGRLRDDLARMEDLRRRFKKSRYDSHFTVFDATMFEDILASVVRDRLNADGAMKRLKRAARQMQPQTDAGFGGRRRRSSLGLPEILGEVAWEIAREASRTGSMPGPFGGPMGGSSGRRSRPRISTPRPSRRGGGGFKTGGGF